MTHFAEGTSCRRAALLGLFRREWPGDNCGGCDNCLQPRETWDATIAGAEAAELRLPHPAEERIRHRPQPCRRSARRRQHGKDPQLGSRPTQHLRHRQGHAARGMDRAGPPARSAWATSMPAPDNFQTLTLSEQGPGGADEPHADSAHPLARRRERQHGQSFARGHHRL